MGHSGKSNRSLLGVPDQPNDFASLSASQCTFVSLGVKLHILTWAETKNITLRWFPPLCQLLISNPPRQVHNLSRSPGNKNYSLWPDVGNSPAVWSTFKNVILTHSSSLLTRATDISSKRDFRKMCKTHFWKTNPRFLPVSEMSVRVQQQQLLKKKIIFHLKWLIIVLKVQPPLANHPISVAAWCSWVCQSLLKLGPFP